MDEIDLVRAARPVDRYPPGAKTAARARLDAAIAEAAASAAPEPARHRRRPSGRVRRATTAAASAQPLPTPGPHQWVYSKELRVEYGGRKPFTTEHWVRVDGRKDVRPISVVEQVA